MNENSLCSVDDCECVWVLLVWHPTSRTEAIQIFLDVMPAPHANAISTGARHEILINHIHFLHAQGACITITITHDQKSILLLSFGVVFNRPGGKKYSPL